MKILVSLITLSKSFIQKLASLIFYRYFRDRQSKIKLMILTEDPALVRSISERLGILDLNSSFVKDNPTFIEFFRDYQPDLLIIDLSSIKKLEKNPLRDLKKINPEIKVLVILSGTEDFVDEAECLQMGFCKIFRKPLDIEVLIEGLREVIEHKG
ncbi:MAG: hypothetical protein N2327_06030 [Caldimicrobium sp.]|nr:hypothetical protein [Caldimicrobium sp.]MCX7873970.1 hypothetical protein [Caldimicrobium sp.]MDW8094191.1 hypothetical protein [Caldimicrobium sp.]